MRSANRQEGMADQHHPRCYVASICPRAALPPCSRLQPCDKQGIRHGRSNRRCSSDCTPLRPPARPPKGALSGRTLIPTRAARLGGPVT